MGALRRADAQPAWVEQTAPAFLQWAKASSVGCHTALFISTFIMKRARKEGSISHLRWGSQDMLWASQQGSGKAEHRKLFFQAEVKSTELCCTAQFLAGNIF